MGRATSRQSPKLAGSALRPTDSREPPGPRGPGMRRFAASECDDGQRQHSCVAPEASPKPGSGSAGQIWAEGLSDRDFGCAADPKRPLPFDERKAPTAARWPCRAAPPARHGTPRVHLWVGNAMFLERASSGDAPGAHTAGTDGSKYALTSGAWPILGHLRLDSCPEPPLRMDLYCPGAARRHVGCMGTARWPCSPRRGRGLCGGGGGGTARVMPPPPTWQASQGAGVGRHPRPCCPAAFTIPAS